MIKIKNILSLILLICSWASPAQNHFAVHFSEDNGFVSNEVFHVFQDHDNYLWFSTNKALVRYDGYKMEEYSTKDGLPSNIVFEVFEDQSKKLWVLSLSNQIAYFNEDSHFYSDSSLTMYQDKHYNYHLIPLKGSYYIDALGNKFISYYLKGIFINSPYFGKFLLAEKDENAFYIYYWGDKALISSTFVQFFNGKIHLVDLQKHTEKIIDIDKESDFDENLFYRIGVKKREETIYFYFYNKIFCINSLSGNYTVHNMDNVVLWLQFDRDETLWAGLYNAGARAFPKGDLMKKPSSYLENEAVTSVCKDKQGGLWFSTMTNGVFYTPSIDITQYSATEKGEELGNISNITKDSNNRIWFCNDINEFFTYKDGRIEKKAFGYKQNASIADIIWDKNTKKVLFGTGLNLYTYSEQGGINPIFNINNDEVYSVKKIKISPENDKLIYVCLSSGFIILESEKGNYHIKEKHYISERINDIAFDDNKLYLGTNKNVLVYDVRKQKTIKKLLDFNADISCLLSNDKKDFLLIGTKGKGLYVFFNEKLLMHASEENGIKSNYIKNILFVNNNLLISGDKGMNIVNLERIKNYTAKFPWQSMQFSVGINDIEYIGNNFFLAKDNALLFSNVDNLSEKHEKPRITKILVNKQQKDIHKTEPRFKYYENTLHLEFSDFSFLGKKRYKYKLINYHNNWQTTDKHSIFLSNLPRGKHYLLITDINETPENTIVFVFYINKLIFDYWFFYPLIISLLVALISILTLTQLKRKKIRMELATTKSVIRQKTIMRQLKPHFIFNVLNSVNLFILENKKEESLLYIVKIKRMIEYYLSSADKDFTSIEDSLKGLIAYIEMETLRIKDKLSYEVSIQEVINPKECYIPGLLIQPFVENSIWHGIMMKDGKGKIKIQISREKDLLKIIVEDDGIGRKKSAELHKKRKHESMGIQLIKQRLDIIRKLHGIKKGMEFIDLYDENNNPCGTKVIIYLPYTTKKP
jgi:hypothetical protein